MSAGRFDRQIATAKRLIALNGQLVTWRQVSDAPADAASPWKPVGTMVTDKPNVPIVFLPPDRVNTQLLRALGKTEIAIGNVYGLMGAVEFEPLIKDVVIRDGQELRISAIDTLSPNGQKLLYTIQFDA